MIACCKDTVTETVASKKKTKPQAGFMSLTDFFQLSHRAANKDIDVKKKRKWGLSTKINK